MRSFLSAAVLISAVALTACDDPMSVLPDDAEIRLMNPVEWPGHNLVLRSAAFAQFHELPEVSIGTAAVAAVRADDSTVTATLPDSAGVYNLTVTLRGGQRTGTVTVAGFKSRTDILPLSGWALPVAPGAPVVLASASTSLVLLDVRTAVSTTLPVAYAARCLLSPGPTAQSGEAVVVPGTANACHAPRAWGVYPGVAAADSAAMPATGAGTLLWAKFAPDLWVSGSNNGLRFHIAGQQVRHDIMSEPERIIMSPGGTLAVPLVQSANPAVPVYSTASGNQAFAIPAQAVLGAVFSPTGDTLFVAGYNFTGPDPRRIIALSPTGTVYLDRPDSTAQIFDLVLDPSASYIYGLAYTIDASFWQPVIHVYDRQTLARVATMHPPAPAAGACCSISQRQTTLSIDPVTRRLYALTISGWMGTAQNLPSMIWEFSVPPLNQTALVLNSGAL